MRLTEIKPETVNFKLEDSFEKTENKGGWEEIDQEYSAHDAERNVEVSWALL